MRSLLPVLLCLLLSARAANSAPHGERFEFTRMIAHLAGYADPGYLDFLQQARPELVQFGFYGAHFFNLVHTPHYGGYPARFPVRGIPECGAWFEEKTRAIQASGIKVVGHFNVGSLYGVPEGPDGPLGFFDFYQRLWDESELGPKPVEDPRGLLERDANGMPLVISADGPAGLPEYYACLRNPQWQAVLRAWIRRAVARGVDGLIANRFYRHNCVCEHCVAGFKTYLAGKYNARQLKTLFEIGNLQEHVFKELPAWHPPSDSTPLRLEMLRWSQLSNKAVFDDLFTGFGRSLKPDLLVAQWTHLGDFEQISLDERCMLPHEAWARDEDYLWYSTGKSAHLTDIAGGRLGEVTLQARYIRGASDDKPFTIGKYEQVRTRVAIAELAANGGAPMGLYANFQDPETRRVFVEYYGFLRRYDFLFRNNSPHAEARLLFPRKAVQKGEVAPVALFKETGRDWLDAHILFTVEPDDVTRNPRGSLYSGRPLLGFDAASRFDAPATVRISANRPAAGNEIDLHFVNYNRTELPPSKDGKPNPGKGAADERPIACAGVDVDFALPPNFTLGSVEFITPEVSEPRNLRFEVSNGRAQFKTPEFLVYGIARLRGVEVPRLRTAGITTVYHHNSHAEMLFGRIVRTDTLDQKGDTPPLELASVFTDQLPPNDISRSLAAAHGTPGFRVADSVREALTLGTGTLAVDAVFLVAEHGRYPESDTGQFQLPKRRLFQEIVDVFERSGRVAPVFFDKHLADTWEDARWIYDTAKAHNIPLLAGSSIPLCWRYPARDLRRGAPVKEIVALNYGRLDSYGFHALEAVQALVERRRGGETGVRSVQCLSGDAIWEAGERGLFDRSLLDRVLAQMLERPLPKDKNIGELLRKNPVLFHVQYTDGLRANIFTLPGLVLEWAAAWREEDTGALEAVAFYQQEIRPYFHFAHQLKEASTFFRTLRSPWPLERTLLTTGLLDALLVSKRDGGCTVETPHLQNIAYTSAWNWTQPPPPNPGRNEPKP